MDKTNSKIITLCFAMFAALTGLVVSLLLKTFAGAFGIIARAQDMDVFRHGLPLLVAFGLFAYLQFNSKIVTWFDDIVIEIRKVVWPNRKEVVGMTSVVIIMVGISSLIISFFDMISGYLVNALMR